MFYYDEPRSTYINQENKKEVQLCTDIQVGIETRFGLRNSYRQNTNDDPDM